ncbi:hypothetical protein NDU88_010888 [Pleurodeles waltl]|uniref:Uncharacterized protein n=1 Tax=Pleurodeles waltl TaxID=8319 RepID=A0AAV7PZ78_PLEWA|nr:hypothetical protein NDU88_010888 [Pleurodeles waltl]
MEPAMKVFLTPASVCAAPSRILKKYNVSSGPLFLRSESPPDSVIVVAERKAHINASLSIVPLGGRGQRSGDGARLIPSLRRGRYRSAEKACNLRAIQCPSEGGVLGAGPGCGRAPVLALGGEAAQARLATAVEAGGPPPRLEPGPRVRPRAGGRPERVSLKKRHQGPGVDSGRRCELC